MSIRKKCYMVAHKISLKTCAQSLYFCLVTFHHAVTVSRLKTSFTFQSWWCNTACDFILGNLLKFSWVSHSCLWQAALGWDISIVFKVGKMLKLHICFLYILHLFNLTSLYTTLFYPLSVLHPPKVNQVNNFFIGTSFGREWSKPFLLRLDKITPQCHY